MLRLPVPTVVSFRIVSEGNVGGGGGGLPILVLAMNHSEFLRFDAKGTEYKGNMEAVIESSLSCVEFNTMECVYSSVLLTNATTGGGGAAEGSADAAAAATVASLMADGTHAFAGLAPLQPGTMRSLLEGGADSLSSSSDAAASQVQLVPAAGPALYVVVQARFPATTISLAVQIGPQPTSPDPVNTMAFQGVYHSSDGKQVGASLTALLVTALALWYSVLQATSPALS